MWASASNSTVPPAFDAGEPCRSGTGNANTFLFPLLIGYKISHVLAVFPFRLDKYGLVSWGGPDVTRFNVPCGFVDADFDGTSGGMVALMHGMRRGQRSLIS